MPRERLVRRKPLSERVKIYLDPYDWLLWLSEELNDDTYDEWLNDWSTPIAISLNVLFILARGASKPGSASVRDDVFGDPASSSGRGWFGWLATFLVQALAFMSCANAFYTFLRKRHYRLFEHSVDNTPATPSAHRVRVDSSPASSPLQILKNTISRNLASSRAHPDPERDVWELRVWDPKPFNLKMFTLFSPGHILLYYTLLPPAVLDPRPSVTILTAVSFGVLLSLQLVFLRVSFTQQAKDRTLVQGEVMHEYNTKLVHPMLNHPVRDVGTQTPESKVSSRGSRSREVDVYQPTTIIKREFKVNPNPNYASFYDPDSLSVPQEAPRGQSSLQDMTGSPSITTPLPGYSNAQTQSTFTSLTDGSHELSSPLKRHHDRLDQVKPRRRDGGSMGVYDHVASPLRKATSSSYLGSNQSNLNNDVSGSRGSTNTSRHRSDSHTTESARRRVTGRF